jgi:hypothetical protein
MMGLIAEYADVIERLYWRWITSAFFCPSFSQRTKLILETRTNAYLEAEPSNA